MNKYPFAWMYNVLNPSLIALLLKPNCKNTANKNSKVRGLGNNVYDVSEFTKIEFYVRCKKKNVVSHVHREINVMKNLTASALIGIDIAIAEGWLIDLESPKLTMPKYHGISVDISTKGHEKLEPIIIFARIKSIALDGNKLLLFIDRLQHEAN
ncbi:hypothetical protein OnM2_090006 [Erysiphe neolycopersici]|uniref:Uncharacterized protein n=1 Tax=Erysiphe neolycopersici TaxID=212602 RepID=A0A420HCW6_9PEZI|nr:hypothetical protein OnM2_090006 [Erysiphe neolycopersici]